MSRVAGHSIRRLICVRWLMVHVEPLADYMACRHLLSPPNRNNTIFFISFSSFVSFSYLSILNSNRDDFFIEVLDRITTYILIFFFLNFTSTQKEILAMEEGHLPFLDGSWISAFGSASWPNFFADLMENPS